MKEPPKNLVAGQKRVRPLGRVATHVFHDSGQTDYKQRRVCEWCGNLDTHRIHDLHFDTTAEAAEIDARQMGESE